jgi:hypothetical protein
MLIDPSRNILRVIAVDAKGDIWLLWSQALMDGLEQHPADTWLALLPPHP